MPNERAIIERLESADVRGLVEALTHHDEVREAALRAHFGHELHSRLRGLALRASPQHGDHGRGRVVFIHDFFGGALSAFKGKHPTELLWMSPARLADGAVERLRLGGDGSTDDNADESIQAAGVLKLPYAEILLTLAQRFKVLAFSYDWRKHAQVAATDLEAAITSWGDGEQPFHIVTHGSGALVARAFLHQFRSRWPKGGRLVMLAPPNRGTFFAPQMLTGVADTLRALAAVDLRHTTAEVTEIVRTFIGLYLMMPTSEEAPDRWSALYDPETYGPNARIVPHHLDAARTFHEALRRVALPEHPAIILGTGHPTAVGLKNARGLLDVDPNNPKGAVASYRYTLEGDGVVACELGRLPDASVRYVEARHELLPSHPTVLQALEPLLLEPFGRSDALDRLEWSTPPRSSDAHVHDLQQDEADRRGFVSALETQARRLARRGVLENSETCLTTEEQAIHHRTLLGLTTPRALPRRDNERERPPPPAITMRVVNGSIVDDDLHLPGPPVDAIAVGHYQGAPLGRLLIALDEAISRKAGEGEWSSERGIIAQLFARGVVAHQLGRLFFLPDPRRNHAGRLIVIAGMGPIGGFGMPEAALLARELCFALAVLGKRHLAMMVIGSGKGNLPLREAVSGIVRGVKEAQTAARAQGLRQITFVEKEPGRTPTIEDALVAEQRALGADHRLTIRFTPTKRAHPSSGESGGRPPTRVTIVRAQNAYSLSALTQGASIPERTVDADPALVEEANDGLVRASSLAEQLKWARVLGELLVPADLRGTIFAGRSVVFELDTSTARIHWEMVAEPERVYSRALDQGRGEVSATAVTTDAFLGIGRGLTRQLRTSFAPTPGAPVPPRRVLRVLVVADPAHDASLVGAREEGAAVVDLFRRFDVLNGQDGNQVEVISLFGEDATRAVVLREVLLHSIDVLHFAGHCARGDDHDYGWVFRRDPLERITRRELERLDRVPGFVFSNACQSGITSGRSDRRDADMAPNFAESFFARGVSNFVCTAWPVEDADASTFALVFYATLLGLELPDDRTRIADCEVSPAGPQTIQTAMQRAREAIAHCPRASLDSPNDDGSPAEGADARTWGAYQHYGDPSFRLFHAAPRSPSTGRHPVASSRHDG